MQNLNYNDAVRDIDISSPIFIAMSEKDKRAWAEKRFFEEIEKADRSVAEHGWLTQEDVERELGYGIED